MARLKKMTNANYLHTSECKKESVNKANRAYIDRFVFENYKRLSARFSAIGNNINSSAFGALDKLNETILSLYTNPDLKFRSWPDASAYLSSKFTEKEIRVTIKRRDNPEIPNEQ